MLFESRALAPGQAGTLVMPLAKPDQTDVVRRAIQRDGNQIASNLISALTQAGLFHRG